MRIFLGLANIASMYTDLKQSFEARGVETFIVNKNFTEKIITDYSDFNIEKAKKRVTRFKPYWLGVRAKSFWDRKVDQYIFEKALKKCDVFIFFWDTFKMDFSDLEKIKKEGKILINVFVGDDVRWYYSMEQEFKKYKLLPIEYGEDYNYTVQALDRKLKYIRTVEKYSDHIFSRLDQAQLELRPYYRWNMMVPAANFKENTSQRKTKPVVAHAPSHRAIKGTAYVLEAFQKLKDEGIEFDPLLIENVSNKEAIEMYANADILIDQLLCPGTGKLATEALACGTIVMGHMAYDTYPQKNPQKCPIIDVNPNTLYTKLKELILDYDFRKVHAAKGKPYVEKYLDVNYFCDKVLGLVNGEQIPYDYEPDFFREYFIPESEESLPVYNKWTKFVSDNSWYKDRVKAGERNGLIF
ncbi:MAG: hypothetical protein V4506_04250 [Bacteroidota bacterium]